MKKVLFTIAAMLLPMLAGAQEAVEIDGIYYMLDEKMTATVTENPNEYEGDITIPESVEYGGTAYSVTAIEEEAFYACSDLTSITIPNSVTSIGQRAFQECYSLTSVTIPDGVTQIYDQTFERCTSLTSVTIGSGVTSLGTAVFAYCGSLTSINIPDGVTWIGDLVFYSSKLTSVIIGSGVTYIGGWAFHETPWYDNQPDGLVYINAVAYAYKGTMPENTSIIIKDGTVRITDNAFSGCSGLTSIDIPSSVTEIGGSAFEDCSGLTSITIPSSVTSIGYGAFNGCSGLTSVAIPDGVTNIRSYAFAICSGLTSVIIGSGVTWIGDGAFYGCSSLTDVFCLAENVPETVSDAFDGSNIANATLHVPEGMADAYDTYPWNRFKEIVVMTGAESAEIDGIYYYLDNKDLTAEVIKNPSYYTGDVVIPATVEHGTMTYRVTSIGEEAFLQCEDLTSVTIPGSVKSIGLSAFAMCDGLTSVNIPSGVTSIGEGAFSVCSHLASITVDEGNAKFKSVDGVLMSRHGSTLLAYPAGKSATDYTIPSSVTSIEALAFGFCGSQTITIPSSVTSIGDNAFAYCSNLTDVFCRAEKVPTTGGGVFGESNIANATLHVPEGTEEAYRAAEQWNEFKEIVVMTGGTEEWTEGDLNHDGVVNAADVVTLVNIIAGKK